MYVGDLDSSITDDDLLEHFKSRYHSVTKVKTVHEKKKNKVKSYGFVYFKDKEEAAKAITEQSGAYIGGKPIKTRLGFFKPSKQDKTSRRSAY